MAVGDAPGGLDTSSWTRLRGGRMQAERVIDLHGRTVQAAHDALVRFLNQASADGVRCVEVVTGHGSGGAADPTRGVIRRELPLWLNLPALRPLVLAAAHPRHNPGSVRLLLVRRR